jgi:hypothetical protein
MFDHLMVPDTMDIYHKAYVWVKVSMRHCPLFRALNISEETFEKMITVIFVFKSSFKIYIIAIFCLHAILITQW